MGKYMGANVILLDFMDVAVVVSRVVVKLYYN